MNVVGARTLGSVLADKAVRVPSTLRRARRHHRGRLAVGGTLIPLRHGFLV